MTCPPLVFIANQIEMHPIHSGVFHLLGQFDRLWLERELWPLAMAVYTHTYPWPLNTRNQCFDNT